MTRRWLQSVDVEVGEDGVPAFEGLLKLLAGDGLTVGRAYVNAGTAGQTIIAAEAGKTAGLLLLAVTHNNADPITITVTDTDNTVLAAWPNMATGTGPFIDSPAVFIPAIEAAAGLGIKIKTSAGTAQGLAVWCKRSA